MATQRYFATLSFHGAAFAGWQVQPEQATVQGVLGNALQRVLGADELPVGAGRTDAGVHGQNYVAHFDLSGPLEDIEQACYKLNRMLPPGIAVHRIDAVHPDAHARFSCTSRSYVYRLARTKDPFNRDTAWSVERSLDAEGMQEAASILVGEHDFSAFAKAQADHTTPFCTVYEAYWVMTGDEWHFHIRANRFLRNMVRALVGTLVELGQGMWTQEEFRSLLQGGDRSLSGSSAPAHGLFFNGASYPKNLFVHGSSEREGL
jgi:tRNA pseudouridine38-40 synthase